MCGLIAAIAKPGRHFDLSVLPLALKSMERRGPDGEGVWSDDACKLGHRRLAIQDLDPRSCQPMHSSSQRFVIVFNGEIYNFQELRRSLSSSGISLSTSSDTEVLIELFAREGEAMLHRLRGMFAFLIWDRETKRAFVARDPYGIKPLYYAQTADGVLFASQVKALIATRVVSDSPCAQGQAGFWLSGSVPEPFTWYSAIRALPAGHCGWIADGVVEEWRVWRDITESWRAAAAASERSLDEVRAGVAEAIKKSVAAHLVSDVPVAVFLSGGIDSGSLAGILAEAGSTDIKGVTVEYPEFKGTFDDEAPLAAEVARQYGITHHVRRVCADEFREDLPRILQSMDQPSIDGINTWYACKAVAELGLKVVISGVGGDELFQGYRSFRTLPPLVGSWSVASRIPGLLNLAQKLSDVKARRTGNGRWHHAPQWLRSMSGAWLLRRGVFCPEDLVTLMGSEMASDALKGFHPDCWVGQMSGVQAPSRLLALGQIESTTYLRNQLLRDSDWASMDHGVELRTPLVDAWLLRDLRDFLPSFHRFPNKRLLAEAPIPALPEALITRRKTGFGIPLQSWRRATNSALDNDRHEWPRYVAQQYGK
jgi:asparagine synthase (glutamine-hydrolysing)